MRRRSRHVAKLNMGEAKDDIHVCIMCLRAIMNNKVMEDPSEDLIAYVSENMFAVFLRFGIMFQNHNVYCLYSRQLCMFVVLFLYENIVETHIIEGSPYVSCLRCLVRSFRRSVNPLNPELNPMCCLLALLGAHHFLRVSRIRVKSLTFRRLMSYIYGAPILDVSRSHTTTQHSR